MYHKIDIVTPSRWWVSVETFERQISDMLARGCTFVYLDEYELGNDRHVVLTFDDGYENVLRHAVPILQHFAIPFEMFVMGELLGKWNHFDRLEMRTRFCSLEDLHTMVGWGGRLQWHTRDHKPLPGLTESQVEHQLSINPELLAEFSAPHFEWFAYPSGMHDDRSVEKVRKKFKGALSVDNGMQNDWHQLNRVTVDEAWSPS